MFEHYFGNDEMYRIFGNPVGLFANVDENVSTVFQLLSVEKYREFLSHNSFNFSDIIENSSLGNAVKIDILVNYASLCNKITGFHPHIEFATGIYQLNEKLPSYSTKETFEFINHIVDEEYDGNVIVGVSLNDTFKSYLSIFNSACYDSCNDFVRKWYLKSKAELIRNLCLTKAIVDENSGEILRAPLGADDESNVITTLQNEFGKRIDCNDAAKRKQIIAVINELISSLVAVMGNDGAMYAVQKGLCEGRGIPINGLLQYGNNAMNQDEQIGRVIEIVIYIAKLFVAKYGDVTFKKMQAKTRTNLVLDCRVADCAGFQIADIYPAQKVIMFVYYCLLTENVSSKELAAYIICVNLFNSMCACYMEGSWNESIKNEYVYFYDRNINERNEMKMINHLK